MLKYGWRGAKPAVRPTPITSCHAERKTAVSRVVDCTGRAVREQSCPFDFEAFKTLTLCVSCAYAAFCIECQALYARDPCVTLCVMGLASAHQNDVLRQRRVYIDVAARRSRVTLRRSRCRRR